MSAGLTTGAFIGGVVIGASTLSMILGGATSAGSIVELLAGAFDSFINFEIRC